MQHRPFEIPLVRKRNVIHGHFGFLNIARTKGLQIEVAQEIPDKTGRKLADR